jgi:hypothetical protein
MRRSAEVLQLDYNEAMSSPRDPLNTDSARERERARERKAALWIIVLSMAISAIVALALLAYFQHS